LQEVKKNIFFFSSLRIFSAPPEKQSLLIFSAPPENKPCLKTSVPSFSGAPCFSFIALAKPA